MSTFLAIVAAAALAFVLIRVFDLGGEVNRVHKRLNSAYEKLSKFDAAVINKLYREVFRPQGTRYPDLGLREWCREWRERLRTDVRQLRYEVSALTLENAGLTGRKQALESRVEALEYDLGLLYQHLGLRVKITPEEVFTIPERVEVVKCEPENVAVERVEPTGAGEASGQERV